MKIKKISIKSSTLICLVALYFATVLNLSFWRYITHNIQIDNPMMLMFAFSLGIFIFVPLYALFNLLICPYVGMFITTILLLGSAAANYYMFVDGVYMDSDLVRNVMETNPRETIEHMSYSFWLYVLFSGVFPALFFANVQCALSTCGRRSQITLEICGVQPVVFGKCAK